MKPTETNRLLRESQRRAAVQGSSATAASGPQSSTPVGAGADVSGTWTPYGRLDITPLDDFILSGD